MNPTPERSGRPRLIQLDVLRGIAILLVLGRHSLVDSDTAGPLRPLAGIWKRFGWTGVDLFFVLSGFLIGGLLFEEVRARGRLDIRRFLIRRAFKIWPLYYSFIVASMVLVLWRAGWPAPAAALGHLREFVPIALNVQNYFSPNPPRWHFWSLAVEEHFYLLLPLAIGWMVWRSRGRSSGVADPVAAVPSMVLTVVIACTFMRGLTLASRPFDSETNIWPTHLRIDGLAFGVLLAYLRVFRPDIWAKAEQYRWLLMVAGLALIAPMLVLRIDRSYFVPTLGFTALYVGYGLILVAALSTPRDAGLSGLLLHGRMARVIAFVGFYSYPIYVWHIELGNQPAGRIFYREAGDYDPDPVRWLSAMATYVSFSIIAGIAMGKLVEKPALAIRERLFPGRTPPILDRPAPVEESSRSLQTVTPAR